ncbi:unnamed protein product [Lactuca virosa]|uniref:Exocyst complex component Sec8 n=1 Tax=Lactuca virosa TaxID=75947 RepID=A0AAU9LJR7_9ASTR|nr:unnamed protein product [Lactuca virosa]
MLQEEFDEAIRSIACVEDIISAMNVKKPMLFDRLLILRNRYLSVEVNLRAIEGMKLDGEEMLFKSEKLHAELSNRCRVALEWIMVFENQRSLLEDDYEVCVRENQVVWAQLVI